MRVYADTSFLTALYLTDDWTPRAARYMVQNPVPLLLTEIQKAEARNSFRLRVAQKRSSPEEVFRALAHYDRDISEGIFTLVSSDWFRIFAAFEKISGKRTEQGAHRFADILHVASALTLEAHTFLTFDQRQARLARVVGLKVPL